MESYVGVNIFSAIITIGTSSKKNKNDKSKRNNIPFIRL